jgi:hypothetical protein
VVIGIEHVDDYQRGGHASPIPAPMRPHPQRSRPAAARRNAVSAGLELIRPPS